MHFRIVQCICECGIAHEYVENIRDDGEIAEDVFYMVVDCITNGQCRHVDNAPHEYYIQEARVRALHIVDAVSGFSKELETHIERVFFTRTG